MLFRNIGLIDETFEYRENMFVGTIGDRIVYIGDTEPGDDTLKHLNDIYADEIRASMTAATCCCHAPARPNPTFFEDYDGTGKVLMPAFYNAHGHSPMCMMRGYGGGLPLDRWLNEKIFPFEAKLYGDAVYWSTLLTMAESMRYGIISTSDMYYFIDDMVKAVATSGMKTNISRAVAGIGCNEPMECLGYREMREAIEMYDGFMNGRIQVEASAHAEYTNNEIMLRAVADAAREYGVRMHVHACETKSETDGCIERYGKTPIELFADLGLFDVPANAAHCIWLTDNDRDILAEKGVSVSTNTFSNLKLASGICDVPALLAKGINVAIGTDSVSSNNSLDFFGEMKSLALTSNIVKMDASAISAKQVLFCATRGGALAQGREDAGLVREGFKADLIVIDADVPNMKPVHSMTENLVFSADGKDVVLTMSDGEVLYRDGEYKTLDIEKTMAEAEAATAKILSML